MLLPLSVALLVAAIVIFALSIMLLDGLMMPKVFWRRGWTASGRNYGFCTDLQDFEPPYYSPKDLWRIKGRMQFYWTTMTLFAATLTFASLILAIVPLDLSALLPISLEVNKNNQSSPNKIIFWQILFLLNTLQYFPFYTSL